MTAPAILALEHVSFAFDGQAPIASDWSAALAGGVTMLHGDTGSGKSTLLRMMAGELAAEGSITLAGQSLAADTLAYRRLVFFVDPWTDQFDQMTPRQCAAALSPNGKFDEAEWQILVEAFSLQPHMEKSLFMLSTGSKRKVYLAAALASSRPLVLLDEPTAALDAPSIAALWEALARASHHTDRAIIVASSEALPSSVPLAGTIQLPLIPS